MPDSPMLTIAAGRPEAFEVRDLRWVYPWARISSGPLYQPDGSKLIVWHHTATSTDFQWYVTHEVLALVRIAETAPYGLPYNFVVTPAGSAYYVNDVDYPWPHTYAANGACAIAVVGTYTLTGPSQYAEDTLVRLTLALRRMWLDQGRPAQVLGHRQVPGTTPTQCPGELLSLLWRVHEWKP
jgi:hypothetical protein